MDPKWQLLMFIGASVISLKDYVIICMNPVVRKVPTEIQYYNMQALDTALA